MVSGYRNVVKPNQKTTTSETPKPWLRTIYSTQKEIVTPTVIAGVTFSAQPLPTPNPLQPWVSLNKYGLPETKKPQIKNGRTKDPSPDYGTYFKTKHVKTYSYDDLKAHNMEEDEVHIEENFEDEDKTYVSLNPIIRCTPDRYFNKGLAKDISSEPFCTPRENVDLTVGKTYFVTWYTRFFKHHETEETVDKVRLHVFYVTERAYDKGFKKRELKGNKFSTEWLANVDGVYPLEVSEEWLEDTYEKKVLLAIQPIDISDDDFDPWEHGVLSRIILGPRVGKNTKEQLALQDAGITDDTWYYVAMTIPTVVLIACAAMYFFLYITKGDRDITAIRQLAVNQRRRVLGKFKDYKKYKKINNRPYSELPIHTKKTGKQV